MCGCIFRRYFTRKSEIEASKKGKKKKGTLEDEFGMEGKAGKQIVWLFVKDMIWGNQQL